MIVAGIDRVLGPQLYVLDPEGSLNAWNAVCIGKKSEKVMESLVVSFGDIAEKSLCVADVLPRFQECLRNHFPSKLMASEKTVDKFMTKQKTKELIALSEKEDSFREVDFNKEASFLPETLNNDGSKRRNRNGIEEDSDDAEYWEFEVTSIMLNSLGEICILPMVSDPHPFGGLISDSITE